MNRAQDHFRRQWFREPGAYVLVDGQFGSTGKGLLAGLIAGACQDEITHVTTNAGPNSGHTAYFNGEQVVTQQIPIASVFLKKLRKHTYTLINAGAIIDPDILSAEVVKFGFSAKEIFIHPNAAVIGPAQREEDQDVTARVAGTGKGVGPALQAKIGRRPEAVAYGMYRPTLPGHMDQQLDWDRFWYWKNDKVFVETAQGFSLGINSKFYPHVTSRECTVMQALADARIPAGKLQKVVMCLRTYPIRVGNTEGSSGDAYPDQKETTWEAIGVTPEMTTVTKRVRRVFEWSWQQFREAVAANEPDVLFLNFCNYMKQPGQLANHIWDMRRNYFAVLGRHPEEIILGFGPETRHVLTCNEAGYV